MKKLTVILFIFICATLFSQKKYNFNYFTKSEVIDIKKKSTTEYVDYFNTEDFSYSMRYYKVENELKARIFDYKNDVFYTFKVNEINKNGSIYYDLNYQGSSKSNNIESGNISFKFVEKYQEIDEKKVDLKIFTKKNDKKPLEYLLTLKHSNKKLFPLFRISFLHPLEKENINYNENYYVSEAKNDSYKYILKESGEVNLKIQIPD